MSNGCTSALTLTLQEQHANVDSLNKLLETEERLVRKQWANRLEELGIAQTVCERPENVTEKDPVIFCFPLKYILLGHHEMCWSSASAS